MKFLNKLRAYIIALLTPDTGKIVDGFRKLEAKLDRSISLDTAKLGNMTIARNSLNDAILAKNADIDAAYKLLNKVTEITR